MVRRPNLRRPPVGVTISQAALVPDSRATGEAIDDAFGGRPFHAGTGEPLWYGMHVPSEKSRQRWEPRHMDVLGTRQPRADLEVLRPLPRVARLSTIAIDIRGIDDFGQGGATPTLTWWATADRSGRGVIVPERTDAITRDATEQLPSSIPGGATGGGVVGSFDSVLYTQAESADGIWVWAFTNHSGPLIAVARVTWEPVWE